jgi:hypothetical protein
MGYTGHVVLARSDGRLDELACIDDLLVAVSDNVFDGGWRLGFLGQCDDDLGSGSLAAALVGETGAPAIAMYVCDSDFAVSACATPGGIGCAFYLDEQNCLSQFEDYDEVEPLNADAIPVLMAWAAEAGFAPDRDRLTEAIEVSPGPFGGGIVAFAKALGLSRPDAED